MGHRKEFVHPASVGQLAILVYRFPVKKAE